MYWKTSDEFPGSISLPYGIKTSHTWHEIGQLLRIINDLDIQTFVELGTHVGGLASLLLTISRYRNFVYFGIEKDSSIIHPNVKESVYVADILEDNTVDTVRRVTASRKTLIYCDGGNKVLEMKRYASLAKRHDVIACHDYFDGQGVVGLDGFGLDEGDCGCKPEVWKLDLDIFQSSEWTPLPDYLLRGTRIMGFIRQ